MKILYIHSENIFSNKANVIQVLSMCNAFSELGNNIVLALPDQKRSAHDILEFITKKINKPVNFDVTNFQHYTINGRNNMLGGYFGIGKLLKTTKPDLCFVRNPIFINQTIKYNIPTIFESHNSILNERYKLLDIIFKRNLIKNSKSKSLIKFIAISNALADEWISKGVSSNKIIALHDGVDSNSYLFPQEININRNKLSLPLDKKIVLYAGSLYENRGIENILHLAKCFPNILFVVLGGPEDRKNHYLGYSKQQNINNISFLGYIPHYKVKKYLFAADVLLMIWTRSVETINYCSPLKMFEYMASGRIIVGHSFPTIKEVLRNGETAFLADPDSFDDLKQKLSLALEESYPSSMAQAARALALTKYTWNTRAQSILNSLKFI